MAINVPGSSTSYRRRRTIPSTVCHASVSSISWLLTSFPVIIILKPICLDQIKKKISTWKYDTLDEYVADFRLMFNNARTFNDESSIVYRDVNLMEAAFNEKFAEMTSATAQAPPQNNSLAMNDYMPMVKQNQDSDDDLF